MALAKAAIRKAGAHECSDEVREMLDDLEAELGVAFPTPRGHHEGWMTADTLQGAEDDLPGKSTAVYAALEVQGERTKKKALRGTDRGEMEDAEEMFAFEEFLERKLAEVGLGLGERLPLIVSILGDDEIIVEEHGSSVEALICDVISQEPEWEIFGGVGPDKWLETAIEIVRAWKDGMATEDVAPGDSRTLQQHSKGDGQQGTEAADAGGDAGPVVRQVGGRRRGLRRWAATRRADEIRHGRPRDVAPGKVPGGAGAPRSKSREARAGTKSPPRAAKVGAEVGVQRRTNVQAKGDKGEASGPCAAAFWFKDLGPGLAAVEWGEGGVGAAWVDALGELGGSGFEYRGNIAGLLSSEARGRVCFRGEKYADAAKGYAEASKVASSLDAPGLTARAKLCLSVSLLKNSSSHEVRIMHPIPSPIPNPIPCSRHLNAHTRLCSAMRISSVSILAVCSVCNLNLGQVCSKSLSCPQSRLWQKFLRWAASAGATPTCRPTVPSGIPAFSRPHSIRCLCPPAAARSDIRVVTSSPCAIVQAARKGPRKCRHMPCTV